MQSPVVTDGRIDLDKLRELLALGGEHQELDFKATANLADKKHALEFVKDVLAMSNISTGGYLVFGVDGQGQVSADQPPVDPAQWDSAELGARVNAFTAAPVRIASAVHQQDGRDVVIVFVHPHSGKLPVPVTKIGQYPEEKSGRQRVVLRQGELLLRRGTAVVTMTYADWPVLLEAHDDDIRARARAEAQDLIAEVVKAIREDPTSASDMPARPVPLVSGLGIEEFRLAVDAAFEQPTTVRLSRFLRQAADRVIRPNESEQDQSETLDELAIVAMIAAELDRRDIFDLAVDALVRVYHSPPGVPDAVTLSGARDLATTALWVEVIRRVLAVGAFLVREGRWAMVASLVNQPYVGNPAYRYSTWIRHASVQAVRANYFAVENSRTSGGRVLSSAAELILERPHLRADVPDTDRAGDTVLDSLVQFDLVAFTLVQAGLTAGHAGYYPAAAAFDDWRGLPVFDLLVTDATARKELLGELTDIEFATALHLVLDQLENESWNAGGLWRGSPGSPAIAAFFAKNPPRADGDGPAMRR